MASRSKLEEMRRAVLGDQRGREVEVTSEGQVVLNSESSAQTSEPRSEEESRQPKGTKLSDTTFG